MSEKGAWQGPRVSVCVPTYNRAPMLRMFLPTILAQTLQDFEVIISDNCSTDDTTDIVHDFRDPRIQYFRNDANIGPFGNFNRLLELACGKYVCIVHDDDIYAPEFLEREAEMLDRHPSASMVHCAVYEIDAEGTRQRAVRAYPTTRLLDGRQEFVRYLQGHNVCCSSVMARREAYRAAAPFESRHICADWLMWLKLTLLGDVAYIADPLLERRVHQESVTGTLNPRWWYQEFMAIFEEGLVLGAAVDPSLVRDRRELLSAAATAQGRRFLIAALAAVAQDAFPLARGYTKVLEEMRGIGLSRLYAWTARRLTNPLGRALLSVVARVRRANARRLAGWSSPEKARV